MKEPSVMNYNSSAERVSPHCGYATHFAPSACIYSFSGLFAFS